MKQSTLFFLVTFIFSLNVKAQLYINEVSQGTGNKEYVELIVAGTPTCGDSTVNLQGWILDDNCGFFGSNGIAGGHIKFANDPQWANIKYGTLIVLYRGDDIFPGIIPDETDANNDNIFVLPSSSNFFDRNEIIPTGGSASAITTYTITGYLSGGGSWVMLGMANGGDAFQTVSPTDLTTAFHSVGWGGSISGTDIHFTGSASGTAFVNQNLVDNNPANQANWVSVTALSQGTPGSMNSPPNGLWISGLLAASAAGGATVAVVDTTICFGDSLFVANNWESTSGSYYDTILGSGGGSTTITDTVYTETFDGPNAWALNTTTNAAGNSVDSNFWLISDNEAGVLPPFCGTSGTGNKSLHITSQVLPTFGAAYNAGGLCGIITGYCTNTDVDVTSDNISTLGYTNIVLTFDFIANGEGLVDNASLLYSTNGGTSFTLLDNSLKSLICGSGQGQWTAASYNLPISAENISNLQIRFNWVNDQNGVGTNPSVAINDVRIAGDMSVSSGGCDTIIQTNLTVLSAPLEVVADLVDCDSLIYNGVMYYTSTSFYADSVYNSNGCLTSFTNVGIGISNSVFTNISSSICSTDSLFLAGAWQNTTGIYFDTLQTANFPNCDSLIVTTLSVEMGVLNTINASICSNDSLFLAGAWQNTAGIYYDTVSIGLCDSITETTLLVSSFLTDTVDVYYCFADIFVYILPDGLVVNSPGIYNSTIANIGSCDSLITTNIYVSLTPIFDTIKTCTNDPLLAGNTIDTLTNTSGCDSAYNTTFNVLMNPINAPAITTCTTDPLLVGLSTDTILSIGGCDSVYQPNTKVLIIPFYTNGADVCTNSIALAGIDTSLVMQSVGGCDSAFSIVETLYISTINQTNDTAICEGESVVIFGNNENQSGLYYDTISNALGCDSIIKVFTLTLNPLPAIDAGTDKTITIGSIVNLIAEGGDSYIWNTNETTQSISVSPIETSTYFVTGTSSYGCLKIDSILVIVLPKEVEIMIPTAFSPNGDGLNDIFRIVNHDNFEDINLRVYNRWGELVFQSSKNIKGWDGVYKNAIQEVDSYIYYIDAKDKATQDIISISGSFALIR